MDNRRVKERRIQGILFIAEVEWLAVKNKYLLDVDWMKTGNGEIYSRSIRECIETLNLPSRTGFENGHKTRIYDTTTVNPKKNIQDINQLQSCYDKILRHCSGHNSREIMNKARALVDISDLNTGDKIHIENRME